MASIGSIFVDFVARTAGFQAGVQQAVASVQQGSAQMQQSNAAASASASNMAAGFEKGFLRVLVGARAFGQVRSEIKSVIDGIDNIPGISDETIESIHRMNYALAESNGALKGAVATLTGWVATAVQGTAAGVAGLIYGFDAMRDGWDDLTTAGDKFAARKYNEDYDKIAESIARSKMSAVQLGDALEQEVAKQNAYAAGTAGTLQERWDASLQAGKAALELQRKINESSSQIKGTVKNLNTSDQKINNFGTPDSSVEDLEKQRDLLADQAYQQNLLNVRQQSSIAGNEKLKEIDDERIVVNGKLYTALQQQAAKYAEIANSIGSDLTGAFVDAANGSKTAFADAGKEILKTIESIIVKILLIKPLLNGIGSVLGGDSAASATGANGWVGLIGAAFSGYKANGGVNGEGQFAVVGEDGPELLAKPGTVISNSSIANAVGGSGGSSKGTQIFIDATGADAAAIQRLQSKLTAVDTSIERRSVAAIIAAKRMGGGAAGQLA